MWRLAIVAQRCRCLLPQSLLRLASWKVNTASSAIRHGSPLTRVSLGFRGLLSLDNRHWNGQYDTQLHFERAPRTNIFVRKLVVQPNPLWLVLDRLSVHNRLLELLFNRAVNRITLYPSVCLVSGELGSWGHTKSSTVQAYDRRTTGAV